MGGARARRCAAARAPHGWRLRRCSRETWLPLIAADEDDLGATLAAELGTSADYLATRVAFLLDLQGPALTVQTACSTSLVCVHLAVQSLLTRECDAAVAGGAAIRHPLLRGHLYEVGGIYSKDGACRPYDARATGIVSGDGAGAIVLKRLGEAVADGDHIHAVIRGSAINNDGRSKSAFTAPSLSGQARAIREALEVANVDPATIGFVEGHGTGTPLGDPIEVAALSRAWASLGVTGPGRTTLGSVKGAIGHLDAAAGVAGLVKACLALEHSVVPGTPGFSEPNPHLDLERSPFTVTATAAPWPDLGGPRRASVNGVGLGGTNAHIVLEQAPVPQADPVQDDGPVALTLSARSEVALDLLGDAVAVALVKGADRRAVARTLREARSALPLRRAVVCRRGEDGPTSEALRRRPARRVVADPRIVFLCPGGGCQYPRMGREAYACSAAFRAVVDRASKHLWSRGHGDLRKLLWDTRTAALAGAPAAFPAIVACSLASAAVLEAAGVHPDAVTGNSLGEITAAAIAGIIGLEDAMDLAIARGDTFSAMPPSGSVSVDAGIEAVEPLLPSGVHVAVISSAETCVVSGEDVALARTVATLEEAGVTTRRLDIPGAVHSPLVEPHLGHYRAAVARTVRRTPAIPVIGNRSAVPLTPDELADPEAWARQVREPVRLDACLRASADNQETIFVDLGPGHGLASLARGLVLPAASYAVAVLPAPREGNGPFDSGPLDVLASLWELGAKVDLSAGDLGRRRVALPVTPLDRVKLGPNTSRSHADHPGAKASTTPPALWTRLWRRRPASSLPPRAVHRAVVLGAPGGAEPFRRALTASGVEVRVTIELAEAWEWAPTLVIDMRERGRARDAIFGVMSLVAARPPRHGGRARIVCLSRCGHDVLGVEDLQPAESAVHVAALVAAQEYGDIDAVCVDHEGACETLAGEIVALALDPSTPPLVALRGSAAWEPAVAPVAPAPSPAVLRHRGVYLVTGGLGRFGSWIVRWLAASAAARVVTVQRGSTRADRLAAEIRSAGGELEVVQADVSDTNAMAAVVGDIVARHGALHGVVHAAGDVSSWASFANVGDLARRGLGDGYELVARAKVGGAEALRRALAGHDVDFCALFSSNASVLGGPGLALYAAANAHLDAIATRARTRDGLPWVAVSWDGWRLPDDERAAVGGSLDAFALYGDEPFVMLLSAIGSGRGHVMAARGDMAARFATWAVGAADQMAEGHAATPSSTREAQQGLGLARAACSVEETMRGWFAELTGAAAPALCDDLFELGGDSLTIMRLRARIRKVLGVDVSLRDLIADRTLGGMTTSVKAELAGYAAPRCGCGEQHPDGPGAAVPELDTALAEVESEGSRGR